MKRIKIFSLMLLLIMIVGCGNINEVEFETPPPSDAKESINSESSQSESEEISNPSNPTTTQFYAKNPSKKSVELLMGEEQDSEFEELWSEGKEKHFSTNNKRDFMAMVDNESDLEDLLKKNNGKVDAGTTWLLSQKLYNITPLSSNDETNMFIENIEDIIGIEFSFVRNKGLRYDEYEEKEYYALYTVLESELGGYLYCWFDYFPKQDYTFLRAVSYLDKELSYSDFANIVPGDSSIDDILEITDCVLALKENMEYFKYGSIVESRILCSDGLLLCLYDSNNGKIQKIVLRDDFSDYWESINQSRPWYIDMSILPQDYPPAS